MIIRDVMMPQKDGYQLSEALRGNALTSHVPIILLTAKGDDNSKLTGLSRQVDENLTKPFSADELRSRLLTYWKLGKYCESVLALSSSTGKSK